MRSLLAAAAVLCLTTTVQAGPRYAYWDSSAQPFFSAVDHSLQDCVCHWALDPTDTFLGVSCLWLGQQTGYSNHEDADPADISGTTWWSPPIADAFVQDVYYVWFIVWYSDSNGNIGQTVSGYKMAMYH